jgi:hypothetical protein
MELEADAYALAKTKSYFTTEVHKISIEESIQQFGFPPPPDNTTDTIYSSGRTVAFWTAFHKLSGIDPQVGEFSAFRFDRVHIALNARLQRILQMPLDDDEQPSNAP